MILAGRNPTKGRNAEALIHQKYRNAKVRFELADMASLKSIKAFSERMLAAGRPINILVNNAGIIGEAMRRAGA